MPPNVHYPVHYPGENPSHLYYGAIHQSMPLYVPEPGVISHTTTEIHEPGDLPDSHYYHHDTLSPPPVVHEIREEHVAPLLHDFLIQEPDHEMSHTTFHGREAGYMYRDVLHPVPVVHGFYAPEPDHIVYHGETYGSQMDVTTPPPTQPGVAPAASAYQYMSQQDKPK